MVTLKRWRHLKKQNGGGLEMNTTFFNLPLLRWGWRQQRSWQLESVGGWGRERGGYWDRGHRIEVEVGWLKEMRPANPLWELGLPWLCPWLGPLAGAWRQQRRQERLNTPNIEKKEHYNWEVYNLTTNLCLKKLRSKESVDSFPKTRKD